jgi:uncharacterized protein (TIGR00251 family)
VPVIVPIRVTPRASRRGITGQRNEEFLIRLTSAPVDDAANEELVELMADALGVPKRNVAIVSGSRSRSKRIAVTGMDAASARARLAAAIR